MRNGCASWFDGKWADMWEKMSTEYLRASVAERREEMVKLREGKPKWDLILRAKSNILREMKLELESR